MEIVLDTNHMSVATHTLYILGMQLPAECFATLPFKQAFEVNML
jgi:hypothetical protein